MQKLIPVEDAKALMREATGWSVWGWLTEKQRLRRTADAAWDALEELERKTKERLPKLALEQLKEVDHAWREAREAAEATFDEAERRMDTSMAREGTKLAIHAWELAEQAIRRAEALTRRSSLK